MANKMSSLVEKGSNKVLSEKHKKTGYFKLISNWSYCCQSLYCYIRMAMFMHATEMNYYFQAF